MKTTVFQLQIVGGVIFSTQLFITFQESRSKFRDIYGST